MKYIKLAEQATTIEEHGWGASYVNFDTEKFAELVEAAARADEREECIKVCEILLKVFLSPQYKTGQPLSSFGERHAVASCVEAIRARETK